MSGTGIEDLTFGSGLRRMTPFERQIQSRTRFTKLLLPVGARRIQKRALRGDARVGRETQAFS
jgi:hypothetical protein